jgi:hypothetical protein
VLSGEQARELLDSVDVSTLVGPADRALIAMMTFGFAHIGNGAFDRPPSGTARNCMFGRGGASEIRRSQSLAVAGRFLPPCRRDERNSSDPCLSSSP